MDHYIGRSGMSPLLEISSLAITERNKFLATVIAQNFDGITSF